MKDAYVYGNVKYLFTWNRSNLHEKPRKLNYPIWKFQYKTNSRDAQKICDFAFNWLQYFLWDFRQLSMIYSFYFPYWSKEVRWRGDGGRGGEGQLWSCERVWWVHNSTSRPQGLKCEWPVLDTAHNTQWLNSSGQETMFQDKRNTQLPSLCFHSLRFRTPHLSQSK